MRKIGGLIFLLGVGSIVLYFLKMEFKVLTWVDNWGPRTGWAIRIGLACLGGIMLILGGKGKPKEEAKQ